MSKKNLSRTAIEGGRAGRNKSDRYQSHKAERSYLRKFKANALRAVDTDDVPPVKKKLKVYKEFTDKLGPVYRWIDKQVGRNWDDVFSEIVTKYDTRTIAGRHIVYDHILREIKGTGMGPTFSWSYFRWELDENNLLQKVEKSKRWPVYRHEMTAEQKADAERDRKYRVSLMRSEWLKDRKVLSHGHKMYWGIPVYGVRVVTHADGGTSEHKYVLEWTMGERLSVDELKELKRFEELLK